MGAPPIVITKIACQDPFQLTLVQDDDVIQAVAPDAPDHSFRISILPRAPRSRQDLIDIDAFDALTELTPIDTIAIPDQVFRCRVERKRLNGLLTTPMRCWACGDIEMDNLAPMMRQDHQDVQHPEPYRRHD